MYFFFINIMFPLSLRKKLCQGQKTFLPQIAFINAIANESFFVRVSDEIELPFEDVLYYS